MSHVPESVRKFQSTLPVRGATFLRIISSHLRLFQSTLPVRGATLTSCGTLAPPFDFNPHSPCGERPETALYKSQGKEFQSTLPVRGATQRGGPVVLASGFQSTLPVRGATPHTDAHTVTFCISIHTPRAGSDPISWGLQRTIKHFNPHSPCGERPRIHLQNVLSCAFQSTLPVRGATP